MTDWSALQPFVPLLIAVLAIAVAGLSVWALVVARRATEPADDGLSAADGLEVVYLGSCSGDVASEVERALDRGSQEIRRSGGRLEDAPWLMTLGESGAGKTTLLADSGLPHPFGASEGGTGDVLNLWLFDETVVLDPRGELILRQDGRSHDGAGWLCLLRQLRERRPRRPLDGLVVTIPAYRLLSGNGTEGDQAALEADASLRANALFQRLAELQQVLGMRLPVYVVITQADHLGGFGAFAETLGGDAERQIFGWSSPYAPEAPYQASWVGEAFDTFSDRLREAQLATFASGKRTASAAAFLDFPDQVAALEPAVRIYLNHLFSHSAFVESFLLRGLYLTGGAFDAAPGTLPRDVEGLCPPPPGPPPAADRRSSAPTRLLFVPDLLQQKVFGETSLGSATAEAEARAKAQRRLAQVLAILVPILGVFGMLWDYRWISRDSEQLAPLAAATAVSAASLPAEQAVAGAGDLVDGARSVRRYAFRGLFLPPSWLSPLNGQVESAFVGGYERLVFPALSSQLGTWQRHLAEPWPAPEPGPRIAYVEETPEFAQLQDFSQQLTRFDHDVWLYDCLAAHCASGGAELSAFDQLGRDLLDAPLRPPTGEGRRFYIRVLQEVEAAPFHVGPLGREALQAQARRLSDRLQDRQFEKNPLLLDLEALNAEIERLELDPNATAADYRLLEEQIERLEKELQRPELAWMGQSELEPGPLVRQTYDALAASPFVGERTTRELEQEGQDGFDQLRQRLASLSNPSTGPLLARAEDGSAKLQLSAGTEELHTAVEDLLKEEFMAPESPRTLRAAGSGERLFWSQGGLKKATDLVTSYQSFTQGGVQEFSADLQGTTEEVALATLGEHMLDALASAQSFRPAPSRISSQVLERGLAMQTRNLTTNADTLSQILDDFQALQLFDAYDQLSAVLTQEQIHLLEDLDALLDLEPLFEPSDVTFAWWQGVQPPAPPAFGISPPAVCPAPANGWCAPATSSASSSSASTASSSTPAVGPASTGSCSPTPTAKSALQSWVADETASVQHLVKSYAEPILGAPTAIHLLPAARLEELTARWQRMVTDADQATQKLPGNALADLGQLITETMMQVDLGNCFALLPSPGAPTGDYFRDRQRDITAGLLGRCRALASQDGLGDYRRYAQIFDERLAGRYPFVQPDARIPIDAEATPTALRDFFNAFDASACLVPSVPAGAPGFSGQESGVRDFVAQMQEVRDFLSPFLDAPKKYPLPTYGYRVQFRVNRNREVGADQIIDWRLQVAEHALTLGLPTSPPPPPPPSKPATSGSAAPTSSAATALGGEWIFGEPTQFSLRWAQESPSRPVTPPESDRVRLSSRTVIYDYRNLWSLLALVRDFPAVASDFPGVEDPQPETIKWVIGTRSARLVDEEAEASGQSTSKVKTEDAVGFLRITFLSPDFATELDVPSFPIFAPRLTEPDFTTDVTDLEVQFTNTTRGSYSEIHWSFGDGESSNETHPVHTYAAAGAYDVTLEVTEDGVTERLTESIRVGHGTPPVADFETEVHGLEVSFTDSSENDPTRWSWSFGDGMTSSERQPTHRYGQPGTYEVTLEASNGAGSDVTKRSVKVEQTPDSERPQPGFTTLREAELYMRFIDESKGEIDSRTWHFGDGHTSDEKNPAHLYQHPGLFTVRLVIKGPGGEAEAIGQVRVD